MNSPQPSAAVETEPRPDVAFQLSLGESPPPTPAPVVEQPSNSTAPEEDSAAIELSIEDQATDLAQRVARELAVTGPEGWHRLEAVFVLTVAGGAHTVLFYDEDDQAARVEPSDEIVDMVRTQRELSAPLGDGPWWRLTLELDVSGRVEVDYDYGDEPFPDEHLLVPEAYRADLEAFPRRRLPVWLAAYLEHDDQQSRSPQQAATQARADRAAGIGAVQSVDDFPVLPVLWARWATIAAAFVAVGSQWGPRILPALGIFEGSAHSGATLYVLPGGRAVLSGGVWNAPELDAAYNEGEPLPDLYAGAPQWVANQALNPRAGRGLLTFCYWWDGGWYRGESPSAQHLSSAVPGIWTAETVVEVVCGVLGNDPSDELRTAAATLVAAAEAGVVTRDTVSAVFTHPNDDIDGALYQLSLAGLVATIPEALSEDRAITLVGNYIRGQEIDTTNYPLEELVAERLSVGWMVFVPVRPGQIAIGRAIFYVADDGLVERSSSSTAPSIYIEGFEQRFHRRQVGAAADHSI
ncbi:hypothetical protein [Nocardia sp. NPDC051570]|uniref:hypothetical protein n=1 Tax=Nocardia sp. NPDC051570 TaxID=3364324 RepID=UPI0037AC1679